MSSTFLIGGYILGGLFCATRIGLFGKTIIKINKDDEHEMRFRNPFWDSASWNSGDCYGRVCHYSFRPIEFLYTEEYSLGWNQYAIDKNGNKY
jgi:hypothetical protein